MKNKGLNLLIIISKFYSNLVTTVRRNYRWYQLVKISHGLTVKLCLCLTEVPCHEDVACAY